VGSFIPETAVEEEGSTADGDKDAVGDKLIASDDGPPGDYEESESEDDEKMIAGEEEAAEEIADEVQAADGDKDAGGDKYIASDDDPINPIPLGTGT
jgi:hypothetical protein